MLQIRKHVLETKAADAMLNNLNDEGIKFIKVLELTGRIVFQRRRWSESEIDIVLLDDHVWTVIRHAPVLAILPCSPPVRSCDGPVMVAVRLYRFASEGLFSD